MCEEGAGVCALLLTAISMLLIIISLPLSLFFVVKVVQVGPGHHTDGFQTYDELCFTMFRLESTLRLV